MGRIKLIGKQIKQPSPGHNLYDVINNRLEHKDESTVTKGGDVHVNRRGGAYLPKPSLR